MMRRSVVVIVAAGGALALSGCGLGTAGAVAGAGGGGGGTNAPATLSGFAVEGPKESPCTLRFVLADSEGDAATVELLYQMPGAPLRQVEQIVSGIPANPGTLPAPAGGATHRVVWDFAAEPDLPDDASFEPGVRVWAVIAGGIQELVPGSNGAELGLGNDAPTVSVQTPAGEVDGVVPLRLVIADSSNDAIRVRAEYDVEGDDPDAGWRLARPAGLKESEPTPAWAFDGVIAPASGTQLVFFWDTDDDLAQLEHDVRVRFTPVDPVVEGLAVATGAFRIDNNEEPIVRILEGAFLSSSDERRGIPIPFEVIDEEGDEVTVVFQWRRPAETFPALPSDPAELAAALADPEQRRALRICSEQPRPTTGMLRPIDATTVELPELASSALHLAARGLAGEELELLRASKLPLPVAWERDPLLAPVAALGLDGGTRALVLDAIGGASWRLLELELSTGAVLRQVASGAGAPSAMAFERGEGSVLVASDVGGEWSIARVELASGAVISFGERTPSVEAGRVRGIESVGTKSCVLTVGSSLVRVDRFDPDGPRVVPLLTGLATPWGVVLDPLDAGSVFVAERDAPTPEGTGRVLSIDLGCLLVEPVLARSADVGLPGFPRPRALALARGGSRLLALCDVEPVLDLTELRGLDLRRADRPTFALGPSLASDAVALASGPDDLVLVVDGASLAVGGGVEQRREIVEHDPGSLRVRLDAALQPEPLPNQPWRVAPVARTFRGADPAAYAVFVWDSADTGSAGGAYLRATPFDAERGLSFTASAPRQLLGPFDEQPLTLASPGNPLRVVAADVDRDGDLDLAVVCSAIDELRVYLQDGPGSFGSAPLVLGGQGTIDSPNSIAVRDVDGDGFPDVVSANPISDDLTVFWQTAPGVFDPSPTRLGGRATTNVPLSAVVCDLDGDGAMEVVSANFLSDTLTVFRQSAPRVFDPVPVAVGSFATNDGPVSVSAVDVDGDGLVDLVSANALDYTLTVFWQTAAGAFDPIPTVVDDLPVPGNLALAKVADVDGDGALDLVAVIPSRDTLELFRQIAPRVFERVGTELGGLPVLNGPQSVTAADVDGDGALELVVASSQDDALAVFRQRASGVFDPLPARVGDFSTLDGPVWVDAADVDGEGGLDLVSSNATGGNLTLFRRRPRWEFGPDPLVVGDASTIDSPYFVATADVDGDGDLDLAALSIGSDAILVFRQSAPGMFDPVPLEVHDPALGPVSAFVVCDVDGDGLGDIAAAHFTNHVLAVHWQSSPGVFDAAPTVVGGPASLDSPGTLAVSDVDGDGAIDLVTSNRMERHLAVFWQSAPRVFEPVPTIVAGAGIEALNTVAVADVDGDGARDLAAAETFNDRLVVFRQLAPRQFEANPIRVGGPSTLFRPFGIIVEDVDGDGRLDLVTGDTNGKVAIFWQEAPGVFEPSPVELMLAGSRPIAFLDVEGDGDTDVVTVSATLDLLVVFRQSSPRSFDPNPLIVAAFPAIDIPSSVAAADVDGDGDPDLVSANRIGNPLTIFFGGR